MNGVHLDSVAIGACATGLDGIAERLTNAIDAFEKTVGAMGTPWGTGEVGTKIGELYEGVENLALSCYEDNVEVMGDFVAALDGTVALMEEFRRTMEKDVDKLAAAVAELYATPRPPQ